MIRLLATFVLSSLICLVSGCAMSCAPYDCHYAAYGGKRPRADMINGRVGSAFQDAGVQMATFEGEQGTIVDGEYAEDGYVGEGYSDESYSNESTNDGESTDGMMEDGSGTRAETGDADSFSSPLEESGRPDLLPESNDNPLRLNSPQDPDPSSPPSQRLQDTLDAINELDNLQQPRAGGADPPEPLDLDL